MCQAKFATLDRMNEHILAGTLPGWPTTDAFNWGGFVLMVFVLPLAILAFTWIVGSGKAWLAADPALADAEQREALPVADARPALDA